MKKEWRVIYSHCKEINFFNYYCMKKFLPIVLVLIILIGVGLFIRGEQTAQAPEKQGNSTVLPQITPSTNEKGGLVSSIKDAMGLGQKMKCTYTAPDGNRNQGLSTIVVDGQKYKFIAEVNGEKSYGIFDGETQYMWSDKTKQGLKMTKSCIEGLSQSVPSNGNSNALATPETPQDFEKSFGDAQGVKCEPSNEDFSLPTDVNFIDQCEIMKASTKAMEGIKDKIPAGTYPGL